MMKYRLPVAMILFTAVALSLLASFWLPTKAQVFTVTGLVDLQEVLPLELVISPSILTPGDRLTVDVRVLNVDQVTHSPEILLTLPAGMTVENLLLPAGVSLNLQTRTLTWLPVVGANGGMQQISLPLRVETADIAKPNQEITAVVRVDGQEYQQAAQLWVGIAPQAAEILAPLQISVGQPLQLRANISGSGPFSQAWELGDGRTVLVNDPLVVFPAAGIYDVRVTVTNPLGRDDATRQVNVVPLPAAQFTMDDFMPGMGQVVTFINQSGGTPPLQYAWNFGDGVFSNEANPQHVYPAAGTYQVHLQVQNQFGQSDAYWNVTVGQSPYAELVVPDSVAAGQLFTMYGVGDESVLRYEWSMGDGRQLEGAQVNYAYNASGDYYITMMAVNEFGATEVGRWITVGPGLMSAYLPIVLTSDPLPLLEDDVLAGLDLPEVALAAPYVMQPIAVPPNSSPTEELYLYINAARQEFGLTPLVNVAALNAVAQNHAADMATNEFTAHIGSDGSTPSERYVWHGYRAGYAGETTAWGFASPREAVEFWVNSSSHRRIILNEAATDVGVGFTSNYEAPNVWYWTAEFGNAFAAPGAPVVRLQQPLAGVEVLVTTPMQYSWNWPQPLQAGQRFELVLHTTQGPFVIAELTQPTYGSYYEAPMAAVDMKSGNNRLQVMPGVYAWLVQLVDATGVIAQSDRQAIQFVDDPNLPTVTPTATETAVPLTPTPEPPTATPTSIWPTYTPPPPLPTQPPVFVTTTPNP